MFRVVLISLIAGLLTACGNYNHHTDYRTDADVTRSLIVPVSLDFQRGGDFYPLPNYSAANVSSPSLLPPGSQIVVYQQDLKHKHYLKRKS